MSIATVLNNQKDKFQSLDRSAKLFILMILMAGVFFAGWDLFFNIYILAKGFDQRFLGMVNSIYPAAILIFGIPMGVLSNRIGLKKSLILGQVIFLVTFLIISLTSSGTIILAVSFLGGIGDTLYIVSVTPLLARLSTKSNRNYLFSLHWGLATLSSMGGNYLAGQLPLWVKDIFGIQTGTAASYQAVLLTSVGLTFLTLIPMFMMKLPEKMGENGENGKKGEKLQLGKVLKNKLVWKFFVPNLQIGLGAALIIPYLNLFFVERFGVSDQTLGTLFSFGAMATGLASLAGPGLAEKLGTRVRTVVTVQGASILFLLVLGFTPIAGVAAVAFLFRGALMNMGNPLYESFSMDQVPEEERSTLNSILVLSWELGWVIGPLVSGFVQESYGFTPLFIATALFYTSGVAMIWFFFRKHETTVEEQPVLQTA